MPRALFFSLLVIATLRSPLPAGQDCLRPVHTHERAGCPEQVAPWAKPSESRHDVGYLVGGNKHVHADGPCANEGTWGWDYAPFHPRRIMLLWSHGRSECSQPGTYKSDGPRCGR